MKAPSLTIDVQSKGYDDAFFPLINDRMEYTTLCSGISQIEDRLVPRYQFMKWTEDPQPLDNGAEIELITTKIVECLGLSEA